MARTCTVCKHDARLEIERALVRRVPYRNIAGQHGLSKAALTRHCQQHLPERLRQGAAAEEQREALVVHRELASMHRETREILERAKAVEDDDLALRTLDRLLRQLQLKLGVIDQTRFDERLGALEETLAKGRDSRS